MNMIYLDNAATTPLSENAKQALVEALETYGNPSSIHATGRKARALLEGSRRTISKLVGCQPGEIIFTSGGTEADNMAVFGAIHYLGVKRIISSPLEHHAISHTVELAAARHGVALEWVRYNEVGQPDLNHLNDLLAQGPKTLVTLMHANNEIGNILDIKAVASICKSHGAVFHSDMVQTIGHYSIDFQDIGVDMASCSAHKFHGPKGVGFLYVRKGIHLGTLMEGGGQQRGHRSGTENIPSIVSMAAALQECMDSLEKDHLHFRQLKDFAKHVVLHAFPEAAFNGESGTEKGLVRVLNIRLPASDRAEALLFELDLAGIAVSGGSACSSGSNTGSHVIKGLKRDIPQRPSVRVSFSRYTTTEDVKAFVEALQRFYAGVPQA